jgi:hypothetical protein
MNRAVVLNTIYIALKNKNIRLSQLKECFARERKILSNNRKKKLYEESKITELFGLVLALVDDGVSRIKHRFHFVDCVATSDDKSDPSLGGPGFGHLHGLEGSCIY